MSRSVALAFLVWMALTAPEVEAQLLSPGRLAEVHAEFEGIRNCTVCHELRQRGISDARCLTCHTPLAARIEEDLGYHASLDDDSCSTCHKDHLGRDFDVRRFDESAFSHSDTGLELEDSHESLECRDCHVKEYISDPEVLAFKTEHGAAERTYLGLGSSCATCHETDNPHDTQFGDATCTQCHDQVTWEEAPEFDHAEADYTLDGEHLQVECSSCHLAEDGITRYTPVAFSECASCHQDPHEGRMPQSCSNCHITSGWQNLSADDVERNFDHEATGFSIQGAHTSITCASCHASQINTNPSIDITFEAGSAGSTYRKPTGSECASCHVDTHDGTVTGQQPGSGCLACHREESWIPSTFSVSRHNDTSAFSLVGSHLVTPCLACHVTDDSAPRVTLSFESQTDCASCHSEDDPHEGEFGERSCDTCHDTDGFAVSGLDHDVLELTGAPSECASCHADVNPHENQFPDRGCDACHTTDAFPITDFDHDETEFPLDGAHEGAPCASCHVDEATVNGATYVRYRPLGSGCEDCHTEANSSVRNKEAS